MHSVAVRMQLAHTPLGARVAAAAVARGRVEDARSDQGALPQRLAPEAPSRWYGVVWVGMGVRSSWLPRRRTCAKQAIGLDEGIGQSRIHLWH